MKPDLQELKNKFKAGRQAEAIAECDALITRHPVDLGIKRLGAMMNAVAGRHQQALELLHQVRDKDRDDPDVLFNIAQCESELKNFRGADSAFQAFCTRFPANPEGWAGWAQCKLHLHELQDGAKLASRAVELEPRLVAAWAIRGDILQASGRIEEACADYQAALSLAPADGDTLKKATLCLLELGQGDKALDLCREVVRRTPDNLTARLGAEWVLSQLVPLWHVPMMNEPERNQAYFDGLEAIVTPDKLVFVIGTGSGLLAMMSARLGARQVVTCEAVGLVARTAEKIIRRNGFHEQVRVLAKPSHQVRAGADLPALADILVHEIFSSELLGEHVLPALEDAKRRLLKPGGTIMPCRASIMVALVGGEELGKNVHAEDSFGFDVREFNEIYPKKRPLYREDLQPELLSEAVEAFRFDFMADSAFPPEQKRIDVQATRAGRCYGLIQWIRLEMVPGVFFENRPAARRSVASWQPTTYGFDEPLDLHVGMVVPIAATHDRARPWFRQVKP